MCFDDDGEHHAWRSEWVLHAAAAAAAAVVVVVVVS